MSGEREIAAEDSIKVVCRFRPLNDSEEKAGSKFIVKFPSGGEENCISIGVSIDNFVRYKTNLQSLCPYLGQTINANTHAIYSYITLVLPCT